MRSRAYDVFCIFIPLVVLTGCASHEIDDLAFNSVERVDYGTQSELGASAGGVKQPLPLLKIRFSSDWNLAEYAWERGFNVANESYFCGRPNDHVALSFPGVYWRGVELDDRASILAIPDEMAEVDVGRSYYIFVLLLGDASGQAKPPEHGFDLVSNPERICFHINGGSEFGGGFRTNTVEVPRTAIVEALQGAP